MTPQISNATRPYSQSEYDRLWQIELLAETLFLQDFPTGSFARWLPQFRASSPDPVGDCYRRRAVETLAAASEEG
jgi:hypothetical protein